jgi:methylmalonyl-CoA mutase N-terminal domain/subunit
VADADFDADIGFPGEYPYTRGLYPNGYRSQLWNTQQFAGYGTAREANARYQYLLKSGQRGHSGRANVNIAFDLPTIYGFDSDDPAALGEVGRGGVAISSASDMEVLFEGFDLANTFTSMVITGPALALFAFYIVAAERRNVPVAALTGVMQNDPLKAYIASKFYIFPPRAAMRIVGDMLQYCSQQMPKWNTIGVSGYHIREAGGTLVHEIAFAFANALAYIELAKSRGLSVDDIAPRISFFFEVGSDFIDEIAKLRAARRLWARLICDRYAPANPKSMMMRCHCQTAGQSLTAQEPQNNVIRTTIQALAAVLGGTQSLHANSLDEALALPSETAVKIAVRTQQIIAHETGLDATVDPLAGSFAVEARTNQIEAAARAEIAAIEERGNGLLDAVIRSVEDGYTERKIVEAATKTQREVEDGSRTIVGVNRFADDDRAHVDVEIFRTSATASEEQAARLQQLRSSRNNETLAQALEALRQAAVNDTNLVPLAIECARRDASLGEIIGTLRGVFGEQRDQQVY